MKTEKTAITLAAAATVISQAVMTAFIILYSVKKHIPTFVSP